MKPIPEIRLSSYYKDEFLKQDRETRWKWNLRNLIKRIEKEDNPVNFRNQLLSISQLYFDGLVEKDPTTNVLKGAARRARKDKLWSKQFDALSQLNLAGKKAVSSFYRGDGVDFDDVKDTFLPYASAIIKSDNKGSIAKHRNLLNEYNTVQTFGRNLCDECRDIGIDTIVCVASGGFEPSYLAMDILEKEDLVVMRYSHRSKEDSGVKLPVSASSVYFANKIKDKTVLVVEDWVASGQSLNGVMDYLSRRRPNGIYCTTVIGCDYYLPNINPEVFNGFNAFLCKKGDGSHYIIPSPGRFLKKIFNYFHPVSL